MQEFSPAKGRRRVVEKFTALHGLWIVGIATGASLLVLFMYLLGFLRLDGD